MSKVLFGQSYYLRFDPKLWEAMQPYPPLGTLYAASTAREHGYDVALFDAMLAQSEDEWAQALDRHRPRFAVLYEDNFNYLSKMCLLRMREAAFKMMPMARARGCTVIVCGSDATDHLERYFAHGADFILIGEAEITLVELLDTLSGRSSCPLQDILGLAYPGPNGEVIRTPARPFIKNLDVLPFPAWDLVDIPRYRQIWLKRHGYYSMNLVTTRGCPYHCNWCAKPIYGQRYNVRSPENVVAEMTWLKTEFGAQHIWFADDILGLKPGWIERFAELVHAHDAVIPFKCLMRVDLIKESTVAALKKAGCQIVWVGAESGSQRVLDAMEKGTKVEEIYEATRRLHQAGIQVGFFLQFGYPGETREDIEMTLQMVRDCQPDDIGISVSYPLPGTKFFENVKAQLGEKQNWVDSNDLAMLFRGTYVPEFYRVLHGVVHQEFRMRKALAALRQPTRLRLAHLRQLALIPYRLWRLHQGRRQLNALERLPSSPTIPLPTVS
ncbi:MAG: radical SAM protein [Chloroflexota bacterium]